MARREGALIGFLRPAEGNLWKLLYNTMTPMIRRLCWKYAHDEYGVNHSLTSAECYSWEKFAEDFSNLNLDEVHWTPPIDHDPRFYYYPMEYNLTAELRKNPS